MQTVNKASTTVKLTSSLNPSLVGQTVTFKITVSGVAPGGGTPAESVTIKLGTTTLGTLMLVNCTVSYSTSKLPKGTFSITAVYPGSADYNGATSTVLRQVVN